MLVHLVVQLPHHRWLEISFFAYWRVTFMIKQVLSIRESISILPILFYLSICALTLHCVNYENFVIGLSIFSNSLPFIFHYSWPFIFSMFCRHQLVNLHTHTYTCLDINWDATESRDSLWRTDIFPTLCLLIHEHTIYFHLFRSHLIYLNRILLFLG